MRSSSDQESVGSHAKVAAMATQMKDRGLTDEEAAFTLEVMSVRKAYKVTYLKDLEAKEEKGGVSHPTWSSSLTCTLVST